MQIKNFSVNYGLFFPAKSDSHLFKFMTIFLEISLLTIAFYFKHRVVAKSRDNCDTL